LLAVGALAAAPALLLPRHADAALRSTVPGATAAAAASSAASSDVAAAAAAEASPHHAAFYTSVASDLARLTGPLRAHQPIDVASSFVRDFRNRATLMNRGLEAARQNILRNKQALDALLRAEVERVRENATKEVALSEQRVENVTVVEEKAVAEVEASGKQDEVRAEEDTQRLRDRRAELQAGIPKAKARVPALVAKAHDARIALEVGSRHLRFQEHELLKALNVTRVAKVYADGFANPHRHAKRLAREIAESGLAQMKAPARAAQAATVAMLEDELEVLADLRSALAKDEAMLVKQGNATPAMGTPITIRMLLDKMHRALEDRLPPLKSLRKARVRMFHECIGRGGATLASGKSACRGLLVLRTPTIFRKHLQEVERAQAAAQGTAAPTEASLEPEVLNEGLAPEMVKAPQEIIDRDASRDAAKAEALANATGGGLSSLRFKQRVRRSRLGGGKGVEEEDEEELTVVEDEHRDKPGGVLAKIAAVAIKLQKEQKVQQLQNEDSNEEKMEEKDAEKEDEEEDAPKQGGLQGAEALIAASAEAALNVEEVDTKGLKRCVFIGGCFFLGLCFSFIAIVLYHCRAPQKTHNIRPSPPPLFSLPSYKHTRQKQARRHFGRLQCGCFRTSRQGNCDKGRSRC
jgi:hypothetical protein